MTLSLFTKPGPWYLSRACRELVPYGLKDRNVVLNCLRAGVQRGMLQLDPLRRGVERIYAIKNSRRLAEYLAHDLLTRLPEGGRRPEDLAPHRTFVASDGSLYPGWMTSGTTRLAKGILPVIGTTSVKDRSVIDTSRKSPNLLARTRASTLFELRPQAARTDQNRQS